MADNQSLVKGRRVRVRIVGTRVDANEIVRILPFVWT